MNEISLNFRDKTHWGEGPWQSEPDKIQYKDEETGLPCLIRRSPVGVLCGYVGVSPTHPAHGKEYGSHNYRESEDPIILKIRDIEVHGGLTYSDFCVEEDKETGICHIAEDNDKTWWFGFDCGHGGDCIPCVNVIDNLAEWFNIKNTYRDIEYVKNEVKSLARQLADF